MLFTLVIDQKPDVVGEHDAVTTIARFLGPKATVRRATREEIRNLQGVTLSAAVQAAKMRQWREHKSPVMPKHPGQKPQVLTEAKPEQPKRSVKVEGLGAAEGGKDGRLWVQLARRSHKHVPPKDGRYWTRYTDVHRLTHEGITMWSVFSRDAADFLEVCCRIMADHPGARYYSAPAKIGRVFWQAQIVIGA